MTCVSEDIALNEALLTAINTALLNSVTSSADVVSYSIGGRTVTRSRADLMALRKDTVRELSRLRMAANGAATNHAVLRRASR